MRVSKIFVTVDVVVLRQTNTATQILFVQRKNEPFQGDWALPGGFVDEHEDLEAAAFRELEEETGLKPKTMVQLKAFGKPHRDPRSHTVSIAFVCEVAETAIAVAADDAADARWFAVNDLPKLAFDHSEIVSFALTKFKP